MYSTAEKLQRKNAAMILSKWVYIWVQKRYSNPITKGLTKLLIDEYKPLYKQSMDKYMKTLNLKYLLPDHEFTYHIKDDSIKTSENQYEYIVDRKSFDLISKIVTRGYNIQKFKVVIGGYCIYEQNVFNNTFTHEFTPLKSGLPLGAFICHDMQIIIFSKSYVKLSLCGYYFPIKERNMIMDGNITYQTMWTFGRTLPDNPYLGTCIYKYRDFEFVDGILSNRSSRSYNAAEKIQKMYLRHYTRRKYAAMIIKSYCHNWRWKPKCKDGSIGIVPRLHLRESNFIL
jgi:hypothetical protein